MASIRCPRCWSANVDHVGGKTSTTINLNPFKPFTLVDHKPKGKQEFHCKKCGKLFKAKM